MALQDNRNMLIAQAVALITAVYAFIFSRLVVGVESRPRITYAPMSVMDAERQQNLNRIYNFNDVECVGMLRMRRAPFFAFAICLGVEIFLETPYIAVWRNKLPCFFTWLVIINGLELFIRIGEGL